MTRSLLEALTNVGKVSETVAKEEFRRQSSEEDTAMQGQIEMIKARRIDDLKKQLKRVTTLRRFRPIARDLLLFEPTQIELVWTCASMLPKQEVSVVFLEEVRQLREWLLSLSSKEQETTILKTFEK